MRLLKVILISIIFSIVISSLLLIIFVMETEGYYFKFGDLIWLVLILSYNIPIFLALGIISYIIYRLLEKTKLSSKLIRIGLSIVGAIVITVLAGSLYTNMTSNETNDVFLIPEGYEGDVLVFYNIAGAPKVETEEGYTIHEINDNGYFITSTPEMSYGSITDKYYYVDKEGNRTPISETCVGRFGIGGFETFDENNNSISFSYTGFNLTKNLCSDEFMLQVHTKERVNYGEIIWGIVADYYGYSPY
ncbi:hypothetical protein RYX45_13865 [Alkalihalophilus pseudofirmus]|uniref:DUF6843 domain-containing protein n=1 Tax=Alkalihalophilus pseudofirmus TaxID=79885 RepID=A0AAJ2NPY3_ALKPS|nr:hypothetical protein [Alkalihalophilus pseudofirmus]MDV2886271.1 hypothetical protein [Alkalihalophilus pseudofirmus]